MKRRKRNPRSYAKLEDLLSSYDEPDVDLYAWKKIPNSEVASSGGAFKSGKGERYLVSMYPVKFTEVRNNLNADATEVRSPVEAAYVTWKFLEAGQPSWTGFVVDLKDGKSWSHQYFYPHFEWNLRERAKPSWKGQGDYVLEKYLPSELPPAADLKAWRRSRAGGWQFNQQIRDVLAQYELPDKYIYGWQLAGDYGGKPGKIPGRLNILTQPARSKSDPRWHVFVSPAAYEDPYEAKGPVDAHHKMMNLLMDGGWTVFVYDAYNDVAWEFETWGPEFEEYLELKSGGRVLDVGLSSGDFRSQWMRSL